MFYRKLIFILIFKNNIYIYNIFKYIYIYIYFFCNLEKCNTLELNAVAFSFQNSVPYFTIVINKFNEYTKQNNIDIHVTLNLYSTDNSTKYVNDYGSTIEFILSRGSTKYDIIFYDNMYSPRYSSYFIDLMDWLPEDHMAMYSSGIASQSCTYKGKWVGLVCNKPKKKKYIYIYLYIYI